MLTFQDDAVRRDLAEKTGQDVDLAFHAFGELEANLRQQVDQIRSHPWIKDVPVHGLIYEVETGRLRTVV
jgi:carbonic anhydrase